MTLIQDFHSKYQEIDSSVKHRWESGYLSQVRYSNHVLVGVLMVYFYNRCEQLLGVNGKLRQELMLIGEPIPELQERLGQLLQVLIQRYKHNRSKQLHSYRSSSRKDV